MPEFDLKKLRLRRGRKRSLAAFILFISVAGYGYYREVAGDIRHEKHQTLASIGELKAWNIQQWVDARLLDAASLSRSGELRARMMEWLHNPEAPGIREAIEEYLRFEQVERGYAAAALITTDGRAISTGEDSSRMRDPEPSLLTAEALTQGKAVLGSIFRTTQGFIGLDVASPVLNEEGGPLGVALLRVNVQEHLFPLVESWPTPSKSAETFLTRRDGEGMLHLNDLRHLPNSAMTERFPMTQTTLPAVRAAMGERGIFEGRDYRDVPVLADLRDVPGTPWFLISKIDRAEILAEARYRAAATIVVVCLLAALATALFATVERRARARLYRARFRAERQARETLEIFRTSLYSIGDGVITTDNMSQVRHMNPVAEFMTGWREADAAGRPVEEIFHIVREGSRQIVPNPVQKVLREGRVMMLENHTLLRARNGLERPIADSAAPIRSDDGNLLGAVLVFSDQSEAHAAKAALLRSETRFRILFESSRDALIILNRERILDCNPAALALFGMPSRDEFTSRHPATLFPLRQEDGARSMPAARNHIDEAYALGDCAFEWLFRRDDGSIFPAEVLLSRFKLDGRAVLQASVRDVTARKQEQVWLRLQSAALEAAADGVVITDANGVILWVNAAFQQMTGYGLKEAKGKTHGQLLNSGTHDRDYYAGMWASIQGEGVWRGELMNRRKGGEMYTDATTITAVRDPGGDICNYIAIKQDVSEGKKLEAQYRQAQKMEAVGRLAGGVAHDFNNMLGIILAYVEMALEEAPPESGLHSRLQQIESAAQRSAELTRQLLSFARKQTIAPVTLDLNATIEELLKMVVRLIGEGIEVEWKPGNNVWPIKMDPAQLNQIMINLSVNARDAIAGHGRIVIETGTIEVDNDGTREFSGLSPGQYAAIVFSDNGCGMDEETKARIFEPFYTTKRLGQGTGLGLATIYGIVKQNGGFIHCESEVGRGTAFTLYFPRSEAIETTPSTREITGPALAGSETVLIVEDESTLLDAMVNYLGRQGYGVLAANSPDEALALAQTHPGPIHMLITDVVMPGMNGREVWEAIRGKRTEAKCLFVSGYPSDAIAHHGVLDDSCHFLHKPFSLADLTSKLRAILASE